MGTQINSNKFTWVIQNFSTLTSEFISSDSFVIGGCKWFVTVFPKGKRNDNHLSLYLDVAEPNSLSSGWRRHTKFSFMVVNQIQGQFCKLREAQYWFNEKENAKGGFGFPSMFSLDELKAKDSGFLVNGELKIVVEIEVLEVVGKLDVPKEESSSVKESIDVNGFQVPPSQVESVRLIFKRHPDIALKFRAKNQHLRTACISVILGLILTLRQSLQELSCDDLMEADIALTYLKGSGFKVDWLEQKLEEVKVKKKEAQICETRVQELEKESKDFKQKLLDIEAKLEKEKAKLLASQVTLDDFF